MNLDRLRVKKDGNAVFVCFDNFVDLQESPAVFFCAESWQCKMMSPWIDVTDTIHLPSFEQINVYKKLKRQQSQPT